MSMFVHWLERIVAPELNLCTRCKRARATDRGWCDACWEQHWDIADETRDEERS